MHIPKAAGTSLMASLAATVKPKVRVAGFDHVLFGAFSDFGTMNAIQRAQIFDGPEALPRKADLVAGHFARSTLAAAYPKGQLITVLREPSTRILSLWMFWRRHSDQSLAGLGSWGEHVRQARQPLATFLESPSIAAQTDNTALRMLLWPHPLIPPSDFIDPAHDQALLDEARLRLRAFAFAGIVESPDLAGQLGAWLGRDLTRARMNETDGMPRCVRTPLASELHPGALDLLGRRSRLDLALWELVGCLTRAESTRLRQQVMLQTIARYAAVMAGEGTPS